MRPIRLEMEGFGAFARRTEIDFTESDVFALTGPTGSGKSTVIDAMCFALYGSVPRYAANAVAPVISLGHQQAKVGFEFLVAGIPYKVARVVRRTGATTASTQEARLESGDDVLAGTADEVTAAIEEIIGLGFGHFTTCVALPQGEFARFLREKPSERQDLLIKLLGLGLFERVAQLAQHRQVRAESTVAASDAHLARLATVNDGSLREAENHLADLERLLKTVDQSLPRLQKLLKEADEASRRLDETKRIVAKLSGVKLPSDLTKTALLAEQTRQALVEAKTVHEQARQVEAQARSRLAALPPKSDLERIVDQRRRLAEEEERRTNAQATLDEANRKLAKEASALALADASMARAVQAHNLLKDQHSAVHLRTQLVAGEECPVCRQVVTTKPKRESLPALAAAANAEAKAIALFRQQEATHRNASDVQVAATEAVAALTKRIDEASKLLAKAPSDDQLQKSLAGVQRAEQELAVALKDFEDTRQLFVAAEKATEGLVENDKRLRQTAAVARDSVSSLDPPFLGGEDPVADWRSLAEWADSIGPELQARTEQEAAAAAAAAKNLITETEEVVAACRRQGVIVEPEHLRDAVVEAIAKTNAEVGAIDDALATIKQVSADRTGAVAQAEVAKTLAKLLSARYFETWVLDEALALLVEGANQRLVNLAGGQYALALNKQRDFEVIDHQAADERRSAKSLSGGETFLVSLALALSLADHLAEMSTSGSSRLESMFLDEGFGTLDQDALATVSNVIQEIASAGKTVGIVTHVRELAEQMPLRYEIEKSGGSASVRVAA